MLLKLRSEIPVTEFLELAQEDYKDYHLWPSKTTIVILISGKAGTGKTTLALALYEYLKQRSPLVIKGSFADGVKLIARECFHWNGSKDTKGRRLLQGIGNLGRAMNEYFWVENLMERVSMSTGDLPPDFLIIDDWRFPNEANYFLKYPDEFKLIRVHILSPDREKLKGTEEYFDVSEVALDDYINFDVKLYNSGSISEFKADGIESILKFLGLKEV